MFQQTINNYLKKHGFGTFAPKVVLFDMDGVLYNSMPHHVVAWQKAMQSFGIDMTEKDVYATEGMKGIDTIRMLVREQQNREMSEKEAQAMYDEKGRLFHEMPQTPIFEGVLTIMRKMKQCGMRIGVVTGSAQKPLINRVAKDFQDFVLPEHIVTAYSIRHGKPAPDPYLKGLELTGGFQPWEGIVVENAPMGVRAGVAAQIFTVAINSGPLPNELLLDEGADLIYPDMMTFAQQWDELIQVATH